MLNYMVKKNITQRYELNSLSALSCSHCCLEQILNNNTRSLQRITQTYLTETSQRNSMSEMQSISMNEWSRLRAHARYTTERHANAFFTRNEKDPFRKQTIGWEPRQMAFHKSRPKFINFTVFVY